MASSKMMPSSDSTKSDSKPQFTTATFMPISDHAVDSTLLDAQISLVDTAAAAAPPKSVDDVWREIVAGERREFKEEAPDEMMTLEDFLVKAGAVDDEDEEEVKMPVPLTERLSGSAGGGGRGKRGRPVLEQLDKAAQQRQRRMIKNRESAARSRERKQAYQVELESLAVKLEEENDKLLKEKAEKKKERFKQLMEKVIPVVEKRRPPPFKHKQHYSLYIFKNQEAFNLCNFTQATILTSPNTTSYTWHPSRPGFFYFTFNNGSLKSCQDSQKLAIKVTPAVAAPPPQSSELSPIATPAPSSGGEVPSSPSFPWPFRPRQAASPGPAPTATVPLVPDKGGGMPFINSNPAVPLPTGEVDSATIRPLPTSGNQGQVMMIGSFGFPIAVHTMALLLL
ncbi:Cupredoxin [Sesbania bispinosa]|nr:Cupredoxin [Sesbania bispinosa]